MTNLNWGTLVLTLYCLAHGVHADGGHPQGDLVGLADWSHKSPEKWPGICQTGTAQSPIDISEANLAQVDNFEPLTFHGFDLTPDTAVLKNDGHSVGMDFSEGVDYHFPYFGLRVGQTIPTLSGGGLPSRFQFAGLHFHWGSESDETVTGSEHTVEGQAYPMELHLVHFNAEYGSNIGKALNNITVTLMKSEAKDILAVLGVFVKLQEKDNPKFEPLYWALDKISKSGESAKMSAFPLADLLPRNTDSFYRYEGSLTTPGCNEAVIWTLFKDTIGISARQLQKFRTIQDSHGMAISNNFRPVQATNERSILDVETSTKMFNPAFADWQNRPFDKVETLVPVTTFVPKFDPSVHTPKEPSADPVEPSVDPAKPSAVPLKPPMPYKSSNALR